MFHYISDIVGVSSKEKLDREIANGKILSYTQCPDGSFEVLTMAMIQNASKKASR